MKKKNEIKEECGSCYFCNSMNFKENKGVCFNDNKASYSNYIIVKLDTKPCIYYKKA